MPWKRPSLRSARAPSDILGLDFGSSNIKAVRLRKTRDGAISVVAAGLLPRPSSDRERPPLPKSLLTYYTALCVSSAQAAVRILSITGHFDDANALDLYIREQAGVSPEQRCGYIRSPSPRSHTEQRVLVVTLPEEEAQLILRLFASGPPAPISLELSGLAAATAFRRGPGRALGERPAILIEGGERQTYMIILRDHWPVLVRKFDFGVRSLREHIQRRLGLDEETARGVMADRSFDISQMLHEVADPFLRQIVLSKEYIERREECRIEILSLSGGLAWVRGLPEALQQVTGLPAHSWDPFEGLILPPGGLPAEVDAGRTRFAAAVGACLGAWESA